MSDAFCEQVALDTNTASGASYCAASRQTVAIALTILRKKMTLEK